jgi:hypothetical protein
MQTTFILKNISEDSLTKIANMSAQEAYAQLTKWAFGDLRHCVSAKCGGGSFGDRVRWIGLHRDKSDRMTMKIEPRRGYKLATFEIA